MRGRAALTLLAGILAITGLAAGSASAAPAPTADYQLQDTYSSSVGTAPDVSNLGTGNKFVTETVGCTPQRVLSFPEGSGLQAVITGSSQAYAVVLLFRFADLSGYRRIVAPGTGSPGGFTTDDGLYQRDSSLVIYQGGPNAGPAGAFIPNGYVEVTYVYSEIGGVLVDGYVNGVKQVSAFPGGQIASSLSFFRDNTSGGVTTEHSAGAVARIRIYDQRYLFPSDVAEISAQSPLLGACDPTKRAQAAVNGKVKLKKRRRIVVLTGIDVSCPPVGGTCNGSAAVTRGAAKQRASASRVPKLLGRKDLSVGAGKTESVRVKLTRKASKALRKKGKQRVGITVKLDSGNGPPAVASRTAKLKLKKKPQG